MEKLNTEDYVPSNNEIRNSTVFSNTERFEDQSVISEDKKQSGDIESSPTLAKPSRSDGRLTRETSIERNSSCFVGDVTKSPQVHFVTGSSYEGTWDALGMSGVGRYTMPHGTIYEGEIRDGMFHGRGSLYWSKNHRLDVLHLCGELKEHRQTSNDGFILDDKDWSYCKFPDRRFYASFKKAGLRPGGRTLKTARQPTKILPYGCYDTGDGIFDPKTQRITSYDDPNKDFKDPDHVSPIPHHVPTSVSILAQNLAQPRPEPYFFFGNPYSIMTSSLTGIFMKTLTEDIHTHVLQELMGFLYQVLRIPSQDEYTWIVNMCRKNWTEPTGYRPELNENWSENPPELPYNLPMSQDSPDNWWRRLTAFRRDDNFLGGQNDKVSKGYAHDTLYPSCHCTPISTSFEAEEMDYIGKTFVSEETSNPSLEVSSEECWEKHQEDERISRSWGKSKGAKQNMNESGKMVRPKDSKELDMKRSKKNIDDRKRPAMKIFDDMKVNDVVTNTNERKIRNSSTFVGEVGSEKNIGQPRFEFDARTLEKTRPKKNDRENNTSAERTVEETFSRKYVEPAQERNAKPPSQYLGKKLPIEEFVPTPEKSSSAEKTFDYTSESIPREKVPRVRKPETSGNGRRLETKGNLSEKVTKTEIEKQYNSYISREGSDVNVIKSNEYFINEYQEETDIHESTSISMEEILSKNIQSKYENSQNSNNEVLLHEGSTDRSKNADNDDDNESSSEEKIVIPETNVVEEVNSSMKTQSQFSANDKLLTNNDKSGETFETNARSKSTGTAKKNVISLDEETNEILEIPAGNSSEASNFTGKERSENSSAGILFDEMTMESRSEKMQVADEDSVKIVQFERESALSDTTMLESEGKLSTKIAQSTADENNIRKTLSTKLPSIPEIIIKETSSVTTRSIDEKSSFVCDDTSLEKSEISCSIKANSASLDQVHPSLVTLVSINPELPREMKDTSKVCQKSPSKKKLEVEPMNVNVWRLSGVNQSYGPKTKIEDLLFHPALTAPRSENVMYTRKQCSSKLCGTTIRDTKTSASNARKQQPCKILAKSAHSRPDRNLNNQK